MRKLTIVFHDAGGGHRGTAEALKDTLAGQDRPWAVTLLNLQELLDSLDLIRNMTGLRIQDTYNQILRRGWTRLTPQLLRAFQRIIRLYRPRVVKVFKDYWSDHPPDLVLSVIPHFNAAIGESLQFAATAPPFVTLITDLADYPPHFWIEPQSQYIIAGTDRARQQARAMGHPSDHIFQTSGMVLKTKFYQPISLDREAERVRLGLGPDCPTGIVLFGGHGSNVMVDIVKKVDQSELSVQLILLCGHNQKLAAELKTLRTRKPIWVQGFAGDVERYMALSDFFIGKPGPASISEALQLHLPVIVECNAKTLPQERYNAEWIAEKKVGTVVTNFRDIASCVRDFLQPAAFDELRHNVCAYSNRALFEVPPILEECWNRAEVSLR